MIPKNAAQVWIEGDMIHFYLAGTGQKGHSVILPMNEVGFKVGLNMLRHRTERSRLASLGDPTQHQINRDIRAEIDRRVASGQVKKTKAEPKVAVNPNLRKVILEALRGTT